MLQSLYHRLARRRTDTRCSSSPVRHHAGAAASLPLRVLFVSNCGELGGAERSLLELIEASDRTRVEVFLCCPPRSDLARAAGRFAHLLPMPLGRIARPRGPRQAADLVVRSAWAVVQLARLIRRHRIDLVHANNTISQLWAGPAARLMSVPCIWHWRDFHDNPPLNRLLARCASASIAISAGVFDFARSQIGTNGRVCLIRNGAADRWQLPEHRGQDPGSHGAWRDPWGIRPEHVMVAMLGQLVPRKGHEVLLRALASAVRCAPSLRLVFGYPDLDGDAPARVEEFRTLAERLGCGGHVTFVGFARDVPELLRDADLVVVPSWREPFGRVAVEAMLAECPVIASRVDGLAEIVLDGETGVLVPPGDADRLSAALVDLAAQPDLRHRMGRKGRQRALECFTIDRVADEVVGQYLRCRRNAR